MAKATNPYAHIEQAALCGLAILEQLREGAARRSWLDVTSAMDKLRPILSDVHRRITRIVKEPTASK